AAQELKRRVAPDADWAIGHGDATDVAPMDSLGTFDVVYSWGVLHHTGGMWRGPRHTSPPVRARGVGLLATPHRQDRGRPRGGGRGSVKGTSTGRPPPARVPSALAVTAPMEIRALAVATVRRRPAAYFRGWREARERGMSRWHDLLDWVGGYPFEVAKPEEIF